MIPLLSSMFIIISRHLENKTNAKNTLRFLSSIKRAKEEMNPAMPALIRSSEHNLLIVHKVPLYTEFRNPKKRANLIESKLLFLLRRVLISFVGLTIFGSRANVVLTKKAITKPRYQPRRQFSTQPCLCLQSSVLSRIGSGKFIFSNSEESSLLFRFLEPSPLSRVGFSESSLAYWPLETSSTSR